MSALFYFIGTCLCCGRLYERYDQRWPGVGERLAFCCAEGRSTGEWFGFGYVCR
jgi:hypothetical protein